MALDILYSLYQNLSQAELPPSKKPCASISAIFRILPVDPPIYSQSAPAKNFYSEITSIYPHLLTGKLQLFFIKRANNPRDLHSGQVAFPGGKKEGNENSFETAVRETYEEVGILLNKENFFYLGRTGEINPYKYRRRRRELLLCTHGKYISSILSNN